MKCIPFIFHLKALKPSVLPPNSKLGSEEILSLNESLGEINLRLGSLLILVFHKSNFELRIDRENYIYKF